jgi:CDP-diacylglycerol--glycerol-3-phosphate 3-phosphatidyltransferase
MKLDLRSDPIWTIPNLLTVMRILLLIPIFIFLIRGERLWVFFLGCLAVGTDLLDGWVARKLKQFSDLGRILDPVFDKIGVLSVVLYMVISPRYGFPLWFFVFMVVREIAVLILGLLLLKKNAKVSESNRAGKWSAFITGAVVLLYILGWQPYAVMLLWVAFILTLYSSYTYLNVFLQKS